MQFFMLVSRLSSIYVLTLRKSGCRIISSIPYRGIGYTDRQVQKCCHPQGTHVGWHTPILPQTNKEKEVTKMAKDPVCGMEVDEKSAPAKSEYMGKTYYFCAPGCKKAFDDNPAKYIEG